MIEELTTQRSATALVMESVIVPPELGTLGELSVNATDGETVEAIVCEADAVPRPTKTDPTITAAVSAARSRPILTRRRIYRPRHAVTSPTLR